MLTILHVFQTIGGLVVNLVVRVNGIKSKNMRFMLQ